MTRHRDFERIWSDFRGYYCGANESCPKADEEYYAWLHFLSLDETKPYTQTRESFPFKRDNIRLVREDAENKYYEVLAGFPIVSMNENVYHINDLIGAARSLIGKHPSLNHKDEFWFSPDNAQNKYGVLTVTASGFVDGAVKAELQVPRKAVCPICDGKPMTELIDTHKIVNVSLEGACRVAMDNPQGQHECHGFEFAEKGFSLLTVDLLPGIPLARIFPIESFLPLPTQVKKHARIKIVGFEKMENKETGTIDVPAKQGPQVTDTGKAPDGNNQCPPGQYYSKTAGGCVPTEEQPVDTKLGSTPPAVATQIAQGTGFPDTSGHQLPAKSDYSADSARQPGPTNEGKPPCPTCKEGEFEDCVASVMASGKDEESANAICAAKCQKGEDLQGREIMLSQALTARAKAELALAEAEGTIRSLRVSVAETHEKFLRENAERLKLQGRCEELGRSQDKQTERMREWQNERLELQGKLNKRETDLKEALDRASILKTQLESLQKDYTEMSEKYSGSLKKNLELNKRIIQMNEDWLALSKNKDDLEERLKKSKRLGKMISVQI